MIIKHTKCEAPLMALLHGGSTVRLWLLGPLRLKENSGSGPRHSRGRPGCPRRAGDGRDLPPPLHGPGREEGRAAHCSLGQGLAVAGPGTARGQPAQPARGRGQRRHMEERRGVAGPGGGATGRAGAALEGREGREGARPKGERDGAAEAARPAGCASSPAPQRRGQRDGGGEGRGDRRGRPFGGSAALRARRCRRPPSP